MIATGVVVAAGLVLIGHETVVFVRSRCASWSLLNNKKTWPARQDRRATDQHR